MITPNALLDLRPEVGQVGCTWRWDLVNDTGGVLGQIHPALGATLTNDTNASAYRTIRNVSIRQSEWADINIFTDYVRLWMVLEDGTQWSQGVFALTSDERVEGTLETPLSTTLVDKRFLLDSTMPFSYGIRNGALVYPAMVRVAELYGIPDAAITDTGARVGGGPVNWPPDATGLSILASLCQRAGFHPPYFDNAGILTLRPPVALQLGQGHVYNRRNGRIRQGALSRSTNLLDAPNAFKVISTGATSNEVYATAYVNPTLPHAKEQTGRVRIKAIRRQGLADRAACLAVAQSYARADAGRYATMTLESVPDPRHDTFDLVEIDGDPYREVSWAMALEPGGTHSHKVVKDTVEETS